MAQQSYNMMKWNNMSSPNQQSSALMNYNNTPCFYQSASPCLNYYTQSPYYYNTQLYYNNNSSQTSPTINQTYSSGYESENSPILQNNYQNFTQTIKSSDTRSKKKKSNNKNQRLDQELFFDTDLLDEEYEQLDFELIDSDINLADTSKEPKKRRVLTKSQRIAANLRERKRMNIMNDSFAKLREVMPITTGRKRRKMSRLDIVVGAIEYIAYLETLLEKEIPGEIDFDSYQNSLYLS